MTTGPSHLSSVSTVTDFLVVFSQCVPVSLLCCAEKRSTEEQKQADMIRSANQLYIERDSPYVTYYEVPPFLSVCVVRPRVCVCVCLNIIIFKR